jgi:integrase
MMRLKKISVLTERITRPNEYPFNIHSIASLKSIEVSSRICFFVGENGTGKSTVILPIPQELLFALETERDRSKPREQGRVLVNPITGRPMTRPRLYQRMLSLGKRAGVADSHPHRFRDTLAVDMLARGATPYDVAKLLGDTIATVEKHYAPFVKELREHTRRLMENGEGLEKTPGTFWAQSEGGSRRMQ